MITAKSLQAILIEWGELTISLSSFLTSFFLIFLVLEYKHLHQNFSGDADTSSPQKVHFKTVPRIGGVGVFIGIFSGLIIQSKLFDLINNPGLLIFICSLPVFIIGFLEDIINNIPIKFRLMFTILGSLLIVLLLNYSISKLDIIFVDKIFQIQAISILFTVFAITGLSNAYNIIDGFNGLASMVGMLSLAAIGFVAFIAGDKTITSLSIITLSSIFGFFIWNYPRGQIFLGDGGAYLIGFWVAALSVGLTVRHENISPWFPLVSNAYPIFETLFSIYRRRIHQGRSPGMPDRLHLHGLIYRRLISHQGNGSSNRFLNKNAKTSIYIWVLSGFTSCFSVAFRNNTPALIFISILFCSIYLWLYKNLIIFKSPKWLKF